MVNPTGFRLGNHTFITPVENGDPDRVSQEDRAPIEKAPPPGWLTGCVAKVDADDGPSMSLVSGDFCGHGEPTYTVFDIELDGSREVELVVHGEGGDSDDEDDDDGDDEADGDPGAVLLVLARRARSKGPWTVLYDAAWLDGTGIAACPKVPELVAAEEVDFESEEDERYHVAIGLEYPCDATSAEDVSWLTIVMTPVAGEGQGEIYSVADMEMA
ncbi:MAG: hypothetical protein H7Y88_08175 [Phycisphaerales bacterium]|nr:hypothetical protein [Phycisphaerales bacterium]